MGKYDPLRFYLEGRSEDRVPLTFAEIERLIGAPLPRSKRYPAWWSNNPSNNTMTSVWLEAGYVTEQVDIAAERLVFRRARKHPARGPASRDTFPGLGCLKGSMRIAEGVDLTDPADPEWGGLSA
jgi:hypothetical protein